MAENPYAALIEKFPDNPYAKLLADQTPEGGTIAKTRTAAQRGVAGFLGAPSDISSFLQERGPKITGPWRSDETIKKGNEFATGSYIPSPADILSKLPGSQFFREKLVGLLGPEVDATTRAGKLAQEAASGAVAGGPFGLAGAAYGALSGGASELAGQATEGTAVEPYARFAAGLLAPLGVSAARSIPNTSGRTAARILGDVSPADLAAARVREQNAAQLGVRLSPSQSLGQAGASIRGLESDIAAQPAGSGAAAQFFRAQDDALANTANAYVDAMGPARSPVQVVNSVQDAARGVIKDAQSARTAASAPWFDAASSQAVSRYDMQKILGQIDAKIAEVGAGSATGKTLLKYRSQIAPEGDFVRSIQTGQMLPNPTIGPLYNVYKETRDTLAKGPMDATAPLNTTRGVLGPINQDVRNILTTNPDLSMGTYAYQMMSPRVNELRQPELLGRLQKATKGKEETNLDAALARQVDVITNPNIARPATIDRVFQEMGASKNPTAARDLARMYFENAAAKSGIERTGGNTSGAVDFVKILTKDGNANAKANLETVVKNVAQANGANPQEAAAGWRNLVATFEAAAERPTIGSRTGPRAALDRSVERGGVAGVALDSLNVTKGSFLAPLREQLGQMRYGQLADVLFGERGGIDALVKLGKLEPNSEAARAAISTLFATTGQVSR